MDEKEAQIRILALAEQVVAANDRSLPQMLSGIQAILDACPLGSEAAHLVKQRVLECQLASMCIDALSLDYTSCDGGWRVAGKLALALVNCFIGADPPDQMEFNDVLLPGAVAAFVKNLNRIQRQYTSARRAASEQGTAKTQVVELRRDLQTSLVNVGDALVALCAWRPTLAALALQHTEWLHIVACPSPSMCSIGIGFMYKVMTSCSATQITSLPQRHVMDIADVLVRRVILDNRPQTIATADGSQITDTGLKTGDVAESSAVEKERTKSFPKAPTPPSDMRKKQRSAPTAFVILNTLLQAGVCDSAKFAETYHPHAADVEAWRGAGFDDVMSPVAKILRRKAAKVKLMQLKERSATLIQSQWRKYQAQRSWRTVQLAIRVVQRWWRTAQRRKASRAMREQQSLVADFQSSIKAKRTSVERRQKESRSVQQVAANRVHGHIRNHAATVLQSHWRGRQARAVLASTRQNLYSGRQHQAARCIQGAFIRFVKRKKKRTENTETWQDAEESGEDCRRIHDLIEHIPDQKRMEFQRVIARYREAHPVVGPLSPEELQRQHEEASAAWAKYHGIVLPASQQLTHRIDVLAARTQTDLDTLSECHGKTLSDLAQEAKIDSKSACRTAAHSLAVRAAAATRHQEMLSRIKLRWWEHPVDSGADWPVT